MTDTMTEEKIALPESRRVGRADRSAASVKQFCEEQGVTEYSF